MTRIEEIEARLAEIDAGFEAKLIELLEEKIEQSAIDALNQERRTLYVELEELLHPEDPKNTLRVKVRELNISIDYYKNTISDRTLFDNESLDLIDEQIAKLEAEMDECIRQIGT